MTETEIRANFPGVQDLAYFNAAAASLLPVEAAEAVAEVARRQRDRGVFAYPQDMRDVATTRNAAARLIGATPGDIAFAANTSEAIGKIAGGLDWRDGDEVVLGDLEYPANVYPWACQRRRGARLRIVASQDGCLPAERLIEAMGPRTRVLAVSMVQFSSGYRVDLEPLSEACRARGILFVLDAIQGLGVYPVDVQALAIGALAADGRKWLMGPPGSGFLYIAREWRDRICPQTAGVLSVRDGVDMLHHLRHLDGEGQLDLAPLLHDDMRRYEAGYPNVAAIAGLGASLALAAAIGPEVIHERVSARVDRLYAGLHDLGFAIYGPVSADERSGIVSFDTPGDPDAWFRALNPRGISLGVRGGRLRAAPHVYNDDADVDRLLAALKELRDADTGLERTGPA